MGGGDGPDHAQNRAENHDPRQAEPEAFNGFAGALACPGMFGRRARRGKWGGKGGDTLRRRKSRHALTALCVATTFAACVAVTANRTVVAQAEARMRDATVIADGAERHIRTTQTTVGAALKDAGVELNPADLIFPKRNVRLYNGIIIRVVRVEEKIITQEEPIAFEVRRKPTKDLRVGLTEMVSEGKRGLKRLQYRVTYVDGAIKRRELLKAEVLAEPRDKVILIGDRGAGVSRGSFVSRRTLTMHATGYDPGPKSCGKYADGRTSIGMKAGYGVVAVDPSVIPLRSKLYIEGYGFAIAGDRGRAIKGHRIDLGFDTYWAARQFGRKSVKVHLLE